jgi:enoyl-CoA hydratase/carnithine racemase
MASTIEATAGFETVICAVKAHVATITLNRPHRRNALSYQAYDELEQAFRLTSADPDVRCVVVTGADPAFCSGDDVGEIMAGPKAASAAPRSREPRPTPAAMAALECAKPVIAAVNGAAMGWGMELALFADIRIASDAARFAELFVKRGLPCDVGGFYRLPAIVGPAKAAELLFTGDIIDAAEALRIGLVSEVVPHTDLLPRAHALAARIAANPPLAVQSLKAGLALGAYGDPREIGTRAIAEIYRLMQTHDHREGVASFLEKRPPVFEGR